VNCTSIGPSLRSSLVRERSTDLQIYCKAWPVRITTREASTPFHPDWQRQRICCPNQQEVPFEPGRTVHFPAEVCAACPLLQRCSSSRKGPSVSIHPEEAVLVELRQRQLSDIRRAKLRERVAVEHVLAHIGRGPGRCAREHGPRKNLFDLRRCAVVHNLHVFARLQGKPRCSGSLTLPEQEWLEHRPSSTTNLPQ
jgi:transposase